MGADRSTRGSTKKIAARVEALERYVLRPPDVESRPASRANGEGTVEENRAPSDEDGRELAQLRFLVAQLTNQLSQTRGQLTEARTTGSRSRWRFWIR